jgi:hypothetical protein
MHDGVSKAKERMLSSHFWPNMDDDVTVHITFCVKCQARKRTSTMTNPSMPQPQCSEINVRVHIDLFGRLKTSSIGKSTYW